MVITDRPPRVVGKGQVEAVESDEDTAHDPGVEEVTDPATGKPDINNVDGAAVSGKGSTSPPTMHSEPTPMLRSDYSACAMLLLLYTLQVCRSATPNRIQNHRIGIIYSLFRDGKGSDIHSLSSVRWQGVPMGLSSSVPFILQQAGNVGYAEQVLPWPPLLPQTGVAILICATLYMG